MCVSKENLVPKENNNWAQLFRKVGFKTITKRKNYKQIKKKINKKLIKYFFFFKFPALKTKTFT